MKKWLLLEIEGMGEKTKQEICLEISDSDLLTTGQAIAYLSEQ